MQETDHTEGFLRLNDPEMVGNIWTKRWEWVGMRPEIAGFEIEGLAEKTIHREPFDLRKAAALLFFRC